MCGHGPCSGGLTCGEGRLEGWRNQDRWVSATPRFPGTSKLRLAGDRGWGVVVKEVTASHHLPVVSQSSTHFLSELHVAEGQRSPPPKLSAFSVSAQSPSKLNWKPSDLTGLSVVVLHTSEMGWEAEGGQN